MKNRSNLLSQHPPTANHKTGGRHHHLGHRKAELTNRSLHPEPLNRDQKLKRHEEHHPN